MKDLEKLIADIEAVENMYLDKKHILKRLKSINWKHVKSVPLQPLLEAIDGYVDGQENHVVTRSSERMSTIKAATHWCKFYAKKLAK
tara:strand:- start:396 stop:656 length:261 start_codon:yes stop_codon:yes gene_type:complete